MFKQHKRYDNTCNSLDKRQQRTTEAKSMYRVKVNPLKK
jgi:hypothetical protein